MCKGLFRFIDHDSDSDPNSNPIRVIGSKNWNRNLNPCNMKSST